MITAPTVRKQDGFHAVANIHLANGLAIISQIKVNVTEVKEEIKSCTVLGYDDSQMNASKYMISILFSYFKLIPTPF